MRVWYMLVAQSILWNCVRACVRAYVSVRACVCACVRARACV